MKIKMGIYKSLSDRLKNQYETIANIIDGKNVTRLEFHPESAKWSIHDNIAHLAKYQLFFLDIINTILEKDTPTFDRYIPENDPDFETWRNYDIQHLLKSITTDRQTIFDLINNLPEENLDRIGIHKKWGELTITQWTEFYLLHEAHHIFTIFKLANDVGLLMPDDSIKRNPVELLVQK
jgi:hypothetical protein